MLKENNSIYHSVKEMLCERKLPCILPVSAREASSRLADSGP